MNSRHVVEITLDVIDVGERLRTVNTHHVEALAAAIAARGLLSPIEVTPSYIRGHYILLAGAHRLAAKKLLGHATIEAFVREVENPLERKLIEIEENLIRHDLTALDRAVFLVEWKKTYNEMAGAKGRGRPKEENDADRREFPLRFSEAVSARLKMNPKSLDKAIKRAELQPDLRAELAKHPAADNGAILDALRKLGAGAQDEIALALAGNPDLSLGDLRTLINGGVTPPKVTWREKMVVAWKKGSAADKAWFRDFIKPRAGRNST